MARSKGGAGRRGVGARERSGRSLVNKTIKLLLILGLAALLGFWAFPRGTSRDEPAVSPEASVGEGGAGGGTVPSDVASVAGDDGPAASESADVPVERLRAVVVASHPHAPDAYTQGLLWHRGELLESTGQYGGSSLRRVELETGRVLERRDLSADLFGEGLALFGDRLIQLTWQEGRALLYDAESFEPVGEKQYGGEGWGLCGDGERLWMSDGSDRLVIRDPETFAAIGSRSVRLDGSPVSQLNELECGPDGIYANLYGDERIIRIDPASGAVTAVIDARNLLSPGERRGVDVLNGIAYRPETGTYLLTGKFWPKLFEVRFEPADG